MTETMYNVWYIQTLTTWPPEDQIPRTMWPQEDRVPAPEDSGDEFQ